MSKGSISKKEIPTPEKGIRKKEEEGFTLKMEATRSYRNTTRRYNPEDFHSKCENSHSRLKVRGYTQKFPDRPPGARTANGTALCH
jgi:hypothetical protein